MLRNFLRWFQKWFQSYASSLKEILHNLEHLWQEAQLKIIPLQKQHLWTTRWALRFQSKCLEYKQRFPRMQIFFSLLLYLFVLRRFLSLCRTYLMKRRLSTRRMQHFMAWVIEKHLFLLGLLLLILGFYLVVLHRPVFRTYDIWILHGFLSLAALLIFHRARRRVPSASIVYCNLSFIYLNWLVLMVLFGQPIMNFTHYAHHYLFLISHVALLIFVVHWLGQDFSLLADEEIYYSQVLFLYLNWGLWCGFINILFWQYYLLSFLPSIPHVETFLAARFAGFLVLSSSLNLLIISEALKPHPEPDFAVHDFDAFTRRYWDVLESKHWSYGVTYNWWMDRWGLFTLVISIANAFLQRFGFSLPWLLLWLLVVNNLLYMSVALFAIAVLAYYINDAANRHRASTQRRRHHRAKVEARLACLKHLHVAWGAMKPCFHALQDVPRVQSLRPGLEEAFDALCWSGEPSSAQIPPCSLQTQAQALFHLQFYLEEILEKIQELELSQGSLEAPLVHLRLTVQQSLLSLSPSG